MGDEVDQYFGSLFDKSPEASHTANSEIAASVEKLKEWYATFPLMKLCTSNHGSRWQRKALAAQIPSQMMRLYQEVIQAPPGWKWQKNWRVPEKRPFLVEHGDDWGGQYPHVQAVMHNGLSVVMGHHHSLFGCEYIKTTGIDAWGAVSGCLIDFEQYAFEYARNSKRKPKLGVIVVADQGKIAIPIPL